MLAKFSKYSFIININKYLLGTSWVFTMFQALCEVLGIYENLTIWKCSHTQKLREQTPVLARCRFSDWHGSPPPVVNNDSRQSCLTGSYWSCSCILLVAPLKDAYFEDPDLVEERKHDVTYKSRDREVSEPEVNHLANNSERSQRRLT